MASSLRLGAGAAALERGPLYYYHGLLSPSGNQAFRVDRLEPQPAKEPVEPGQVLLDHRPASHQPPPRISATVVA